ncbi:MAG: rod shape-determining protein MreC [Deltaproteobacteria bacterium]|jgi:rod shape-determining protein MreC|nr:rod shape-determining protein MreC [Deltaproteobacteria bacterium]
MPRRWKIISPVALFILALALISAYVKNPQGEVSLTAKAAPLAALGPVSGLINRLADGVAEVWRGYFSLVAAQKENDQLKVTVGRLKRQLVELEEVKRTNQRLGALLELKAKNPADYLSARILAWDPGPWFQAVVIDAGAKDGVNPEAAVLSSEGLVGRVVELAPQEAKVLLITDRSSGVDAFVQRNRVNVLVTGLGPGRLELEYTRKGEDVRLGDLVVSSGLDGIFPAGQALGVVTQVDKVGLGLFLKAELRPSVDFSGLMEVLVLKNKPLPFDWTTLGSDARLLFEKKGSRPRSR